MRLRLRIFVFFLPRKRPNFFWIFLSACLLPIIAQCPLMPRSFFSPLGGRRRGNWGGSQRECLQHIRTDRHSHTQKGRKWRERRNSILESPSPLTFSLLPPLLLIAVLDFCGCQKKEQGWGVGKKKRRNLNRHPGSLLSPKAPAPQTDERELEGKKVRGKVGLHFGSKVRGEGGRSSLTGQPNFPLRVGWAAHFSRRVVVPPGRC